MTVQHTFKGTKHLDNAVKYVSNLKVSIQKKKNQTQSMSKPIPILIIRAGTVCCKLSTVHLPVHKSLPESYGWVCHMECNGN